MARTRSRKGGCGFGKELAISFVAALFEAEEDFAHGAVELFADKEDAMKMVGHKLKGYQFHFGMHYGDLVPAVLYPSTQRTEFHARSIGAVCRSIAAPQDFTKERTAVFGNHRYHVHATGCVVVAWTAALHGRNFLLP